MAFQKIVAPTPKELFLSQVVKKILAGELKPGERLPTERDLAELLDINRSTVHTGLEELEHMGFVRMEPRRGNFVADYANDGDFNTLTAIAKYGDGQFTNNMRISMVELRNSIVGGAMIRLAKIGSKADFDGLKNMMLRHHKEELEDLTVTTAAKHMLEFNTELTRLSGNTMFLLLMNTFGERNLSFWERCVQHWGTDNTLKQESIIIEMLENGKGHDAALYIENMYEHYMEDNQLHR